MRVVVTGPLNPHGQAIVRALAAAGHHVRAFGVPAGTDPFHHPQVECFPGQVEIGGSLEPVAAEAKAIVHAACLDEPGNDPRGRQAFAVHLERGTLYTRYAAERELVNRLVVLLPGGAQRAWKDALAQAEAHAKATKATIATDVLRADAPARLAAQVASLVAGADVPSPPEAPAPAAAKATR